MRLLLPRLGRSGQFIPIVGMVVLTSITLLFVVTNIYRVARAKLIAQNLADSAALTIASLQAKSINIVIDRNEYLNRLYTDQQAKNKDSFPGISEVDTNTQFQWSDSSALQFATWVRTTNRAQLMFIAAFHNFLGVGSNSGTNSLYDILGEIKGLRDPSVMQVLIFDSQKEADSAEDRANQLIEDVNHNKPIGAANKTLLPTMHPIPFVTEPVRIQKVEKTLTQLIFPKGKPQSENEVGWMHPVWNDPGGLLSPNSKEKRIGAGVIVIKKVTMYGIYKDIFVQAKATAFVVKESGLSVRPGTKDKPPAHFLPTYYVQLGSR